MAARGRGDPPGPPAELATGACPHPWAAALAAPWGGPGRGRAWGRGRRLRARVGVALGTQAPRGRPCGTLRPGCGRLQRRHQRVRRCPPLAVGAPPAGPDASPRPPAEHHLVQRGHQRLRPAVGACPAPPRRRPRGPARDPRDLQQRHQRVRAGLPVAEGPRPACRDAEGHAAAGRCHLQRGVRCPQRRAAVAARPPAALGAARLGLPSRRHHGEHLDRGMRPAPRLEAGPAPRGRHAGLAAEAERCHLERAADRARARHAVAAGARPAGANARGPDAPRRRHLRRRRRRVRAGPSVGGGALAPRGDAGQRPAAERGRVQRGGPGLQRRPSVGVGAPPPALLAGP
mmetsp:Transcript_77715/g.239926  ORF Transcript_77715/g.239926 Transcript_77715/m.239926 type:complete len:345 (-) Transcript_77715:87-1121(-)